MALVTSLSGCANLDYLAQSAGGHVSLMLQRRPIGVVMADPNTAPWLREKLQLLVRQRQFAYDQLALPDNGSYRTFVDLGRPYVTWTVVVTPRFSMMPLPSCFPLIGCVPYRGFFDEADARIYAASFAAEEYDTYVGGVRAYSTLGWFADPVLSTMTMRSESGMAAVLFHELAHQRLYVADDATFNESYAVAVEQVGVARWFDHVDRAQQFESYARASRRRKQFTDLVAVAKTRLLKVYAASSSVEKKLADKREVFAWLRQQHAYLRARWGGRSVYSRWFDKPLNNAKLALVGTYAEHVSSFLALYRKSPDMEGFHRAAQRLGRLTVEERRQELALLGSRSKQ